MDIIIGIIVSIFILCGWAGLLCIVANDVGKSKEHKNIGEDNNEEI